MKVINLGPIQTGEIELAPLTILCGANNQGKTYFSYTAYGILKNLPHLVTDILTDEEYTSLTQFGQIAFTKQQFITKIVTTIASNFQKNKQKMLEDLFRSELNAFEQTEIELSHEEILSFIYEHKIQHTKIKVANMELFLEILDEKYTIFIANNDKETMLSINNFKRFIDVLITKAIQKNSHTFYIPAERIGINVFRGQLNANKIEMLDSFNNLLGKDGLNAEVLKAFKQINHSYPQPIEDYLDFINGISSYDIDDQHNELAVFVRQRIIKGRFVVDAQTEKSYYRSQTISNDYQAEMIPLHITSSAIKSVYGLDYFFEKMDSSVQNVLIIDEPEMNLHPKNQIEFAKLLDLMIANGVKVIISTHSDFLVRKIQNIMLQNELANNEEGLNAKNVAVYNFEAGHIEQVDLLNDAEAFDNFNEAIIQIEDEYLELLEARARKRQGDANDC